MTTTNHSTLTPLEQPYVEWIPTRPQDLPEEYTVRKLLPEDDARLRQMMAVPIPTRGVLISYRREPSYFDAQAVCCTTREGVGVFEVDSGKMVATLSNGWRPCWVSGQIVQLRYSSDLRIVPRARGKITRQVAQIGMEQMDYGVANFTQTIVNDDNQVAIAAMRSGKSGYPPYYDDVKIKTLTITSIRTTPYGVDEAVSIHTATVQDAEAMNQFAAEMGQHYYRGLPVYDFTKLESGDLYYQNLHFKDFILLKKAGKIVGMVGLWNQKPFKQTVIQGYPKRIALLRPFYNFWQWLVGGMQLPKQGESIPYLILHSLLCKPEELIVHDMLIREAWRRATLSGIPAITYTLAESDPRIALNQYYKGELLVGLYGYFSNQGNPMERIDQKYIPFLEAGRI